MQSGLIQENYRDTSVTKTPANLGGVSHGNTFRLITLLYLRDILSGKDSASAHNNLNFPFISHDSHLELFSRVPHLASRCQLFFWMNGGRWWAVGERRPDRAERQPPTRHKP